MIRSVSVPVMIPQSFNADGIINSLDYRSDKKLNLKSAMYVILHTLLEMESRMDLRDDFEERGYYPLHSEILIQICGNRYKEALILLEQHAVIDSDKKNKHSAGNYSKGYRLINPYSSDSIRRCELPNGGVKDRFVAVKRRNHRKNEKALPPVSHLVKWLNPDKISIDVELAHYFIGYYRAMMHDNIPDRLPKSLSRQEVVNRINQRYNSGVMSVKKIIEGDFSPTKTGKDQRLHTSISSIKSELRTLIKYGDKHLVSLDLTASQPYLFTQLLNPGFYEKNGNDLSVLGLYPELHSLITSPRYRNGLNTTIMSTTYAETQSGIGLQGSCFLEIDWSGDFYSYLMQKEAEHNGGTVRTFKTRSDVKKSMMLLLYNKEKYKYRSPEFLLFNQLFPREANIIRFFDSLEGDNYLPILLQRLESKLLLEKVGKVISEAIPDAPLLTVHDSFLTTPGYAVAVKRIMSEAIFQYTRIIPGIKQEEYDHNLTMSKIYTVAMDDLKDIITHSKSSIGSSQRSSVQIGLRGALI